MNLRATKSLQEIQKYSQYIVDRTTNLDVEDYLADLDVSLAVERALINIGVAAWRIREDDSEIYDEIPALQRAIGLRNRLAHGYDDDISDDLIWLTITTSIPNLLKEVNARLGSLY